MYWWKIEELKGILAKGELSQRVLFIYIFLYVVLSEIAMEFSSYMPYEDVNSYDYSQSISYLVIVIFGTYIAYRVNNGNEGIQFAERYFSIGWVVTIRFIPLLIVFALLARLIDGESPVDEPYQTTPTDLIIGVVWILLVFWRIIANIKDVASR